MSIKTVTEQIYNEIREAILSQNIPAGEKLTIKMLHEKYGVSSSPIREALTRLQQDGLIEYKPNIGMNVIKLTKKDIDEIFSLITELDIVAMKFAMASEDSDKMLADLEEVHSEAEKNFSDSSKWNALSDEFHLTFYKFAQNDRLAEIAKKLRMQLTIFSNEYEKEETNRADIHAEHGHILELLKAKNISQAEDHIHKHMNSSLDKALKVFENIK